MVEVRFHGRGGQGIVTASQILASALVMEGYWVLAFPEFGPERRGAPVRAYLKFDTKKIFSRERVSRPDVVVVADDTLPEEEIFEGTTQDTLFVVNSTNFQRRGKVYLVDATEVALRTIMRPIPNTAMVGAFAKALGTPSLTSIKKAMEGFFAGRKLELNLKAVELAFEKTRMAQV